MEQFNIILFIILLSCFTIPLDEKKAGIVF